MLLEKIRTVKGKILTGDEVAALKYKTPILVSGQRSVVLEVHVHGQEVELIYTPGVRVAGRDRTLLVRKFDKVTPVQLYVRTDEGITPGMKNAYKRMEGNALVCTNCDATVPRYPGRYPGKCPNCGETSLVGIDKLERCKESEVTIAAKLINECIG